MQRQPTTFRRESDLDAFITFHLTNHPGTRRMYRVVGLAGTRDKIKGLYLRVDGDGFACWFVRYQLGKKQVARRLQAVLDHVRLDDVDLSTPSGVLTALRQAEAIKARGEWQNVGERSQRHVTTVNDLLDDYIEHHASVKLKRWKDSESALKHVRAVIGHRDVAGITSSDTETVLATVADRPALSNKVLASARSAWAWGAEHGKHTSGQPWTQTKQKMHERTRVGSWGELRRILRALPDSPTGDAIRLICLTGCRRQEIIAARREWLDLNYGSASEGEIECHGRLVIPASARKNSREHVVFLSAEARAIVDRQCGTLIMGKWLFPSDRSGSHLSPQNCADVLKAVIEKLGIPRLTLHDLRRSMASWAEDAEFSDRVIQIALGHTPHSVAGRHYTHGQKPLHESARLWREWSEHLHRAQLEVVSA